MIVVTIYNTILEFHAEYRETFRMFDKNGDGSVTVAELGSVIRSLGHDPTDEEIQDMINDVDVDRNGNIDFKEFIEMMLRNVKTNDIETEVKLAYKAFDLDGDGYIT